jgi:tight adherence protein C
MLAPLLAGLLGGLGVWCIARAIIPNTPPLDQALASLSEPRWSDTDRGPAGVEGQAHRLGRWIMDVTGADISPLKADLAMLNRTEEVHLIERLKTAAFWAAVPPMFLIFGLIATGNLICSPTLIAAALVMGLIAGWFLTDGQIRTQAATGRTEFEAALTTYLGLVSIGLAGGAGIQQALQDAVEQGDGSSFTILRRSLTDARVRGVSPWISMGETGERMGLEAMTDLSSTMELAGTSGAHIRESLMTKAKSLRNHQIAQIEREASGRTTAMAGPTGLMMAGFVVLLIYPALRAVLAL